MQHCKSLSSRVVPDVRETIHECSWIDENVVAGSAAFFWLAIVCARAYMSFRASYGRIDRVDE